MTDDSEDELQELARLTVPATLVLRFDKHARREQRCVAIANLLT